MIGVVLVFGPPLVIAATMLSPQGLAYTLDCVVRYTGLALVLLPIFAWPTFLIQLAAPPPGQSRLRAIISLWLGGAVLVSAAMNLLGSMLEYSPHPPNFDPAGHQLILYTPQGGFLLGCSTVCMLVSCGIWGVVARIIRSQMAVAGAVMTGGVLFVIVYGGGYLLFGT